jgi:hypothetical protein
MSDISNQLIKDSYNYVLQSDLSTGNIYRIGGGIPVNPIFLSGLTINSSFKYSNGLEQHGYVLTSDAFGNSTWSPITGFLPLSGGTISGATRFTSGLTANTISATTYQNLPTDIRVTGATYSNNTFTYRNNTGGTFNVLFNTMTGLTANTISATTYQNLPTDIRVTGGTYTNSTGITTFRNNTGGTFNVGGYFKPSDDIYLTSGIIGNGPDTDNNIITLTNNNGGSVYLTNLVDIVTITKTDMDTIISNNKVIKGKTYKIENCDTSLYLNGTNGEGRLIYTTIYLTGLESNKLSESGVGVFYTPKYSTYPIFIDGESPKNSQVIWGGYVWGLKDEGAYNSIDIFTLPEPFNLLYPFENVNTYNSEFYNEQYDDIIYDYTNDRIIYRNEQNSNIVSTTFENINYWINRPTGIFYNPIRVFQWGNLDKGDINKPIIVNQQIINSYNENINYRGRIQGNFYFNNLSYQKGLLSNNDSSQIDFIFENGSYQEGIVFNKNSSQTNIVLNNNSYQTNVTIENTSFQKNINFTNESFQNNIFLIGSHSQSNLDFTNESSQENMTECSQSNLIFEGGKQLNGANISQVGITIKNFNRDLTSITHSEANEFYINDLPSDNSAPVYIGKINNRLVEVTVGGGVSDLRTKNNVEYITGNTSSIINQLKPVKFEFNNYSGITRHGFIAQDVLEINPRLVLGDGEKENRMYSLDYYGILALTVKSLQEANNRIDVLEKIIKNYPPK